MDVLGIDIGGSGIKGAPVDTDKGILMVERVRIPTPQPSRPKPVAKVILAIKEHFDWHGPICCGFPAVVQNGVTMSAANVDKQWIGTDAEKLFQEITHCSVKVINDADAAGLAEMRFGAGKDRRGVVIMITVGTGLGSSIFIDGKLFPNTELGHLEFHGGDAEAWASDAARKNLGLSWKKWGKRFNEYLHHLEILFSPDVFIIGGGISKNADRFIRYLDVRAELLTAQFHNDAGVIGAALAYEYLKRI